MAEYIAQTGLDYAADGESRRVEAGDVVSGFADETVAWLIECEAIALVDTPESAPDPTTDPTTDPATERAWPFDAPKAKATTKTLKAASS